MTRNRELVGRTRAGRPVRNRSVLDTPARDSVEGLRDLVRFETDPATAVDLAEVVPAPRRPVDTGSGRLVDTSGSGRLSIPVPLTDPGTAADATADDDGPARAARRRLPRPPRRKAPLLLLALVVGGVLAALPGGIASRATTAGDATAGDYGLSASESNFAGGMEDADSRREITQAEAAARLDALAASRAEREPDVVLPTDGIMTTCYCQRWGTMHWGIDLAAPLGTPIVAATDGVVLRAGPASGFGYAIYIQDADGNVEVYGHMRYMYVAAGDVVSAGDLIAKVGSEGQSTGPHLHFEIHLGSMTGRTTDPEAWLNDRGISVPQ